MNAVDLWQMILTAPADAELKNRYVQALIQAGARRAEIFSLDAEFKRLRSQSFIDRALVLKPRLDALIAEWRHAVDIVATLPVRHLNLKAVTDSPAVFEVPQLGQIASLDCSRQSLSDDAIKAMTSSPELGALRWLDLSHGGVTETQVELLAAAASLRAVEMIDFSDNPTRDPVDGSAGAGWDWMTGKIELDSIFMPEFGVELERRHGEITWLHALRRFLEAYPPSRYSF